MSKLIAGSKRTHTFSNPLSTTTVSTMKTLRSWSAPLPPVQLLSMYTNSPADTQPLPPRSSVAPTPGPTTT